MLILEAFGDRRAAGEPAPALDESLWTADEAFAREAMRRAEHSALNDGTAT